MLARPPARRLGGSHQMQRVPDEGSRMPRKICGRLAAAADCTLDRRPDQLELTSMRRG